MSPKPSAPLASNFWKGLAGAVRVALTLAVTGLTGATVLAELGAHWWVADLFAHFRFHYLVAVAVIVPIAFVLRARILVLAASAVALLQIVVVAVPTTAKQVHDVVSPNREFRVATVNVLWSNRDQARVERFIEQSGADIVCLQEVGRPWARMIGRLRKTYSHAAPAQTGNGDTMVLSRFPITGYRIGQPDPKGFLYVEAAIRVGDRTVKVLCVHPPYPLSRRLTRWHRSHFKAYTHAAKSVKGPIIVVGDFNLTPFSPRFRALLQDGRLALVGRGALWPMSWPAKTHYRIGKIIPGIPIDHILVNRHFAVRAARRGPYIGSDHYPVIADLVLNNTRKKLNRFDQRHTR